jgi:CheY-like chemotaxis protein
MADPAFPQDRPVRPHRDGEERVRGAAGAPQPPVRHHRERFDRDTPILYLFADAHDMARAYAAGAQGCVSRQFDTRVLLTTARALLESGDGMPLRPALQLQ